MEPTAHTNKTYDEFVAKVNRLHAQLGEDIENWRYGQTYFNVLASIRSDLSETIRGTPYDPFYKDEIPEATENLIKSLWCQP